jgi:hypothetical protein
MGELRERLVSPPGSQGDLSLELGLVTVTTTFHFWTPEGMSRA